MKKEGKGYVYGYQYEGEEGTQDGLGRKWIKIGFTNSLERRKGDWHIDDSRLPIYKFAVYLANYKELEKIVHKKL